ncbi:biotin--[acetyl-CoA-carboxylase] ligase [Parasphaerochaeta coccoides]|uniref:Bifunctional ligase/repressor BirA n=1 Tax=Parasphaerochaeta coccoides (strain ATCC BAA-1237 / DSM 17374 / SPN1) TaxID=760011 RepID=F4GJG4_PARC1|nr:biotin--[acetyl-CoA-carboxylase] ligase [Parasphaerochaeta coccoides]AEC02229.1 biotin/acetyl-CoA-carboxylase ligase [Parasphaerochaeta coccoides DSM 17374]
MGIKEDVVTVLERNKGTPVSGETIASALGVSRAAVWKSVKELQSFGVPISASTNKGYTLDEAADILSRASLSAYVDSPLISLLEFHDEIGSTNQRAKTLAVDGASHGTTVVARTQSGGRGRRGRAFASPEGGIYLSIVLRPERMAPGVVPVLITTAAAVAVARAVERVCHLRLDIKWVNDLFLNGRKVCGILTEGIADMENGGVSALVVGIGINFSTPVEAYPEDIRHMVRSLFPGEDKVPAGQSRAMLAAAIMKEVIDCASHLGDDAIWTEYRDRCFLLGKKIRVEGNSPHAAVAEDIDRDFHLHVRLPDGSREVLAAGEVSIRFDA